MENKAEEYYQLGLQQLKDQQIEQALASLNKALALSPDHPDYLSDRAVCYFHLGKLDLALIDMNHAQELQPKNPYRYSSRAFIKDHIGDIHGAIADYQRAIELDPEDAIAYNNLGMLEEKLGHIENAKKNFKRADDLNTEHSNAFIPITNTSTKKNEAPIEEPEPLPKKRTIVFGVFSSRKNFFEFFAFVFRGFKLKK